MRLEPGVQFGKQQPVPYHPFTLSPPATRTAYDVNKNGHFVGLIPAGRDEEIPAKPLNAVVVVWNWFETLKQNEVSRVYFPRLTFTLSITRRGSRNTLPTGP